MKTLKNLFYTLLVLAAGGFASCSDDDTERTSVGGVGVYFAIDLDTEIALKQGQSSFVVPINRTDVSSDFDLIIVSTIGENTPETLLSFPYEVHFAAGQKVAEARIDVDVDQLVPDRAYDFSLTLSDADNLSPYGLDTREFTVTYAPWEYVGEGYFRDDLLSSLNGAIPFSRVNMEYTVEIYENLLTKGLYRIENPYSISVLLSMCGMTSETDLAEYYGFSMAEHTGYLYFNASDPEKVYLPKINDEIPSCGVLYGGQAVGFRSASGQYGTLRNGVVTLPKNSVELYFDGRLLQGFPLNAGEQFRILMPGTSQLAPSVTVTNKGILTGTDDDSYAVFNVKMNVDAVGFYWNVFEGTLTAEEAKAEADDMFEGKVDANHELYSGEIRYLVDTKGAYTAVFVPYSEENLTGTPVAIPFEFNDKTFVDPADFTATFLVENLDESEADITVVPVANNLRYVWGVATKKLYDEVVDEFGSWPAYELQLATQNAANAKMTLEAYIEAAGIVSKGKDGGHYEDMPVDTDLVVYAYCVDPATLELRSKEVSIHAFRTLTMPALLPEYEKWLGTWTVSSPAGLLDKSDLLPSKQTFEIEITVKKANKLLYIRNWGGKIGALESMFRQDMPLIAELTPEGNFTLACQEVLLLSDGSFIALSAITGDGYIRMVDQPILEGSMTDEGNTAATVKGLELEDATVVGADYFGWMINSTGNYDLSLLTETHNPVKGPYTMTKKAAAPADPDPAETASVVRRSLNRKMHAAPETQQLHRVDFSRFNCVERR